MEKPKSKQPKIINIDEELRIRKPLKDEWKKAFNWYSDSEVMYLSEGIVDRTYSIEEINNMYSFLSEKGEMYFIEILKENMWISIGDVTLMENNLPIVLGEAQYRGKGIGKKVIKTMLIRAKEIEFQKITIPEIYKYNSRSRNLFLSFGFEEIDEDEKSRKYELKL